MTDFYILVGIIGGILAVISIAGYRKETVKKNEKRGLEATNDRNKILTKIDIETKGIKDKIDSGFESTNSIIAENIRENVDDVILSNSFIFVWGQLEKEKIDFNRFGYKPSVTSVVENNILTNKVNFLNSLEWFDFENGNRVKNSNFFFTVKQSEEEKKNIQAENNWKNEYILCRNYKFIFEFDILVNSKLTITELKIDYSNENKDKIKPFYKVSDQVSFSKNDKGKIENYIHTKIDKALDDRIFFYISLKFIDSKGIEQKRNTITSYDSKNGNWEYGN